ncbi:hypothetical protein MUB24_03305 [Lederbergia sp. NSJ-179]|uniref:hypothetical protein n=1 Tax=Lederbergia sp. NSJ-179 TaxID=2931402 RepID=UPI001FD3CFC6|nr:hypothetical protein [Lederbergia sp. NSJ-179]MCJ7839954.1 hypothetical protein [Lederbergia sp. NSJ-179]
MKIEVNVQAPELVIAINNLANAMGSAPAVEAPKSKVEKVEKKEANEPETFKKASYFYHEASDAYLAFKKGDEVPTDADFQMCDPISKKEYDKGIAEQKKAEKPEEDKEDEQEVPSVEEVRAKTAEAAKAGKKEEIKDLLAELGVSAVSKIPENQRAEYLEKLDEL